jgi:hypothetical protein
MSTPNGGFLKRWTIIKCAAFLLLVSTAFTTVIGGLAQPAQGQMPLSWEDYRGGEFIDRLNDIFRHYGIIFRHVARMHYSGPKGALGDVDLFRVSERDTCDQMPCYYVLFSADLGEIPIITACPFERSTLEQNHHPDGSLFYAFQFSCERSVMQVQISHDHFFVTSVARPGN